MTTPKTKKYQHIREKLGDHKKLKLTLKFTIYMKYKHSRY